MLRHVRGPLIALILGAVGLCGCGGGPSDTEQVQAAVEAFGRATAAKDYQRLCDDLLAPELVEEVASAGLPCEAALRQGLGDVQAPTLTIGAIKVGGDRATAEVNSAAQGQPPSRDTLQLVRVDDAWRIASLAS
jgi:hypothetical protein